jgi:hypothetical protein
MLPRKQLWSKLLISASVFAISNQVSAADCPRGSRPLPSGCVRVEIPENAELDVFGTGWTCRPGYKFVSGSCAPMTPEEFLEYVRALAPAVPDTSDFGECRGYTGPGGACYSGPGGGLYSGPGGGLYSGPGGGLYSGPGGGLYSGPGGGMYSGPGGGLYTGPGGGLYSGPGGGIYTGPPSEDGYKGPWGPCITGVKGEKWMRENCPL